MEHTLNLEVLKSINNIYMMLNKNYSKCMLGVTLEKKTGTKCKEAFDALRHGQKERNAVHSYDSRSLGL